MPRAEKMSWFFYRGKPLGQTPNSNCQSSILKPNAEIVKRVIVELPPSGVPRGQILHSDLSLQHRATRPEREWP